MFVMNLLANPFGWSTLVAALKSKTQTNHMALSNENLDELFLIFFRTKGFGSFWSLVLLLLSNSDYHKS
jgi:hypothetical protein